jgi:putative Holliday junction resolvase
MRVLGVDYGAARVGLAMGDTETRLAGPWSVLARTDDEALIHQLQDIVRREGVERMVVGLPHPLKDQARDTAQTDRIRLFIERLRQTGIDVVEENETWSSSLAAKQGIEAGSKGKRDDLAAANILQGYLDRHVVSS